MSIRLLLVTLAITASTVSGATAQSSTGSYTLKRSTTPDGRTQTQRIETAPNQLARTFERFDVNGDGFIDAAEERRGRTQAPDGSQSRAGGLIAFLDRDRDGRVSLREFSNTGLPPTSSSPTTTSPRQP